MTQQAARTGSNTVVLCSETLARLSVPPHMPFVDPRSSVCIGIGCASCEAGASLQAQTMTTLTGEGCRAASFCLALRLQQR